jgi:hypothetical protein
LEIGIRSERGVVGEILDRPADVEGEVLEAIVEEHLGE